MTDKITMTGRYVYRESGEPARVLCVDAPGEFPVVAVSSDGKIGPAKYNDIGQHCGSGFEEYDLIPAPEPAEDPALTAAREWLANAFERIPSIADEVRAKRHDHDGAIRCGVAMWHAGRAYQGDAK